MLGVLLVACAVGGPLAASLQAADVSVRPRLVEPRADQVLKAMCERLAGLERFAFDAEETFDEIPLVNIGSNRRSFKWEIGVSKAIGRWHVEGATTLWLFTGNQDYFGGQVQAQEPVVAIQGHVVYSFRPGMWLGLDVGYLDGGTTTVDGRELSTLQSNSRAGVTLQVPFAERHGVRVAFSRGVRTRIGADFTTLVLGYQVMWGQGF